MPQEQRSALEHYLYCKYKNKDDDWEKDIII